MFRLIKDGLGPNSPLSHTAVHMRATRCMWNRHKRPQKYTMAQQDTT